MADVRFGALRRHPLVTYFCLAFLISWAFWLPLAASSHGLLLMRLPAPLFYNLAALGPLLGAVLTSGLEGGRPAIRALLAKVCKWRVGIRWYLAALLGYPALLLLALALDLALGGAPAWPRDDLRDIHMPFWFLLAIMPLFVLGEEIGWRGYALPRLQRGRSALWATLILGLLWAAWHVPSFTMRDSIHSRDVSFPIWTLWLLTMALALTWLYNGSGGSVLIAWLYHVTMNYGGFVIPLSDRARAFASALVLVAALLIVVLSGPARLGRQDAR